MAEINFDASMVNTDDADAHNSRSGSFEPLPEDKYVVCINDTDRRFTRNKDGEYLELTLEVIEGPFKGRKLWPKLNLWNNSDKAVEIAEVQLAQICKAVGIVKLRDTNQLHGKILRARVTQREWNGQVQNDVKGYEPRSADVSRVTQRDVSKIGSAGGKGYTVNEPAKGKPKPQYNQAAWDAEHGDGKAAPKTPDEYGLDEGIPF